MRRNPALAKLNAGGMTSGISVGLDSPDLAELAAHAGFEYVWLEWQHGQFSEHTLNNAIARFLPVETAPIVRVKSHEPGAINHVLDMGAMGVIVPMVETADEARAIAHVTYYPPLGRRSTGGTRLSLLGDDYTERANDEMLLVVMVETESAINKRPRDHGRARCGRGADRSLAILCSMSRHRAKMPPTTSGWCSKSSLPLSRPASPPASSVPASKSRTSGSRKVFGSSAAARTPGYYGRASSPSSNTRAPGKQFPPLSQRGRG